jgi:F-type H+-transporting ATPase subunit b
MAHFVVRGAAIVVAFTLALSIFGSKVAGAADGEEHTEQGAIHQEHGEGHEAEFNWAYGFLGEKEGVEPSLLYRPTGMPHPFLANVINAAVLFGIIVRAGKKPVREALRRRKTRLVGSMEEAAKMKADSEVGLAAHEKKLAHLDDEIERVRREMREAAEAERHRILSEARERRDRMERDARLLVEQEEKAARETLMRETVASAVRSAEEIITKQLGSADHDRIARDFLETVRNSPLAGADGRS